MSLKKKIVSLAEKKSRMLDLFHQTTEFFTLKDLEKIAPKEKGITANTVKDVLQVLVDEGQVDTDKVGSNVVFWSFPSKAKHAKVQKCEALQQRLADLNERLQTDLEPRYAALESSAGADDSEYVDEQLKVIAELQREQADLEKELKANANSDPERIEAMRGELKGLHEASNRWTDNVFQVKSWCKTKFNCEDKVVNKQFGIPNDFDYIE